MRMGDSICTVLSLAKFGQGGSFYSWMRVWLLSLGGFGRILNLFLGWVTRSTVYCRKLKAFYRYRNIYNMWAWIEELLLEDFDEFLGYMCKVYVCMSGISRSKRLRTNVSKGWIAYSIEYSIRTVIRTSIHTLSFEVLGTKAMKVVICSG